ncbi:MAG: preprotein translocase subunit SecE [Candidatus Sericytochromatia bacterium]|nr:preprotein translocase subunit SecE [Candidatus Sericytochromatia bacterium]
MAKKSSTETEIEKSPEPNNKKDKVDGGKNLKGKKSPFEDLKKYVQDSFSELKKVQWPTRKQATAETIVVLITVFFLTSLVLLFDNVLSRVFGFIFK